MKCSLDDVRACLELISARVPDRHITVDDAVVAAYASDLQNFPRQVLFRAGREFSAIHFPGAGELLTHIRETERQMVAEDERDRQVGQLETTTCPNAGCDNGWVTTDGRGHGVMYPCPACKPIEHAVWRHRSGTGHDEGHCPDCKIIRKHKGKEPEWLADAKRRATEPISTRQYESF